MFNYYTYEKLLRKNEEEQVQKDKEKRMKTASKSIQIYLNQVKMKNYQNTMIREYQISFLM